MGQNTTQRIAAGIRARIRSGELRPGDRVPSARALVREHGIALATASRVLAQLRREGLVRVQPGVGTVVRARGTAELSRDGVVQAAISIADDEGTAELSMRGVARELGVPTMSLYRHVGSRDELLLLMTDAALGEVEIPAAAGRPWRERLEELARLAWEGYRRHPWLAQALSMTRPQLLPNGMRHTDAVLEAVSELGLPPVETMRAGIALLAWVRGMASSLEAEIEAERDTGLTSDEWMREQEEAFAPLLRRRPTLSRLAAEPEQDLGIDALFECGLGYLLDGLAGRAPHR
jgi:AcrR family transcriptional regulator